MGPKRRGARRSADDESAGPGSGSQNPFRNVPSPSTPTRSSNHPPSQQVQVFSTPAPQRMTRSAAAAQQDQTPTLVPIPQLGGLNIDTNNPTHIARGQWYLTGRVDPVCRVEAIVEFGIAVFDLQEAMKRPVGLNGSGWIDQYIVRNWRTTDHRSDKIHDPRHFY
ncbi:hypothetical protein LTS07_010258 [Exophiala sideris]|uniref:Uncharacterized protein n=1 Tax=Exophiala sideris TaxID=1016849 RepID=A0ABR0JA70_9EURO|nr:hypothetical protein LTS07_010258 [Exophiala sideris]KAK5037380.1 hypothetical protein LTR13_004537 [Exophiala sideris]KAK5059042.1 hypothetical protein LTR69_006331 [Exophiala sideris]KAK5182875.1 hypothetical protein LTR44_004585 [Eurotiomycetes sp. CCFEE 6388]